MPQGIQQHLSKAGAESLILTSDKVDDQTTPGVRLCTMHRVKSIEFKAVAIPFMSNTLFPLKWLLDTAVDDGDQNASSQFSTKAVSPQTFKLVWQLNHTPTSFL